MSIFWSRDLTFPWQPCFQRVFYEISALVRICNQFFDHLNSKYRNVGQQMPFMLLIFSFHEGASISEQAIF